MEKQRNSKQRQIILNAVMSRCDHPTADQIYFDVRTKDNKISRGTVYRNLRILSGNGEITNVKIPLNPQNLKCFRLKNIPILR